MFDWRVIVESAMLCESSLTGLAYKAWYFTKAGNARYQILHQNSSFYFELVISVRLSPAIRKEVADREILHNQHM